MVAAQVVPGEVLSKQLLADAFGLRATVVEVGGALVVVPDRRLFG
jgi:iron complex transport system ATP-binding protein